MLTTVFKVCVYFSSGFCLQVKQIEHASSWLQVCELTLSMPDISSLACEPKYLVKDVSIIYFILSVEG